jgi:hypothetical protein
MSKLAKDVIDMRAAEKRKEIGGKKNEWRPSRYAIHAAIFCGFTAVSGSSFGNVTELPNPVLSGADLSAISAPQRTFRPHDQFDAAPAVKWAGRRFIVELPVRSGGSGGCTSMPFWSYNAATRKLSLTFFGDRRSESFLKGYDGRVHPLLSSAGNFNTLPIKCIETSGGSYRASNAFGATTTIYRKMQTVAEVAFLRPIGRPESNAPLMDEIDMEPGKARQITQDIRVRYEGRLLDWGNGSVVSCGIEHYEPDMQSAYDTKVDTCLFRASIDKIAFINGADGSILAETDSVQ